jgi:hypothetical protein
MLGNKGTLTVAELIEVLKEMPQDFKVYSWEGDKRIPISDVVNAGDVVDLYNYDIEQNEVDEVGEDGEAIAPSMFR